LAKSPSEISLKDVIEVLEGPIRLVDCLADPKICRKIQSCVTREIWNEATDAINRVFGSVTLEEMVNRRIQKEGTAPPMYQI
jgi:DNA-binding IscR family transcriptional regulator